MNVIHETVTNLFSDVDERTTFIPTTVTSSAPVYRNETHQLGTTFDTWVTDDFFITENDAENSSILNGTLNQTIAGDYEIHPMIWYSYASLACFGVVTNSINILVLLRSVKKARFCIYLIGAAISDLLFCLINLIGIPFQLVDGGLPHSLSVVTQIATFYLTLTFGGASTFITVVMAAERAFFMAYPLKIRCSEWASKQACLFVLGCFITAAILRIPLIFFIELVPVPSMNSTLFESKYSDLYFSSEGSIVLLTMAVLFEGVPFLILMVLNIYIIVSLKRYLQIRQKMSVRKSKNDRHTTALLLTSVACFLLFETPNTIIYFIRKNSSSTSLTYAAGLSNFLLFFNHCIHLVFFCLGSKEYRVQLKSLFCKAIAVEQRSSSNGMCMSPTISQIVLTSASVEFCENEESCSPSGTVNQIYGADM